MKAFFYLAKASIACGPATKGVLTRAVPFKRLFTAAVIIAFSAAPGHTDWLDGGRTLDRGGDVGSYLKRIVSTGAERHVISGDCMSACTMWLGKKGVCVTPDAVLYFHAASTGVSRLYEANPWQSISHVGNGVLLGMYPPRMRAVVRGWLNSPDFHTLSGRQLAALGVPLGARSGA